MTQRRRALLAVACGTTLALASAVADAASPDAAASVHDYPTVGRVEYVLTCMDDNGHDFVNVYKCSCAIDKIAAALNYDEFVEQSTSSKYATLGGEGGAEFRVDRAKEATKKFRALQASAYHACGIGSPVTAQK